MPTQKRIQNYKLGVKPMSVNGMKGFVLSDIQEALNPKQFTQFQSWMTGQTVGMYKKEIFIYTHDVERFLMGIPPID